MPSTKTSASRPSATIATAAQRTRSVIEDLQSRLTEVSQQGALERPVPAAEEKQPLRSAESESEDELERQLEAYFSEHAKESAPGPRVQREHTLEDLRRRVVDRVVERILEDWEQGGPTLSSRLREEVIERLVERIFSQFRAESE